MKFKDKVVVITGGTRGIGKALVESFLKQSATVVIIGSTSNSVNASLEYFKEKGYSNFVGYPLDIGNADEVKKTFKVINTEYPTIDVLINNAGITRDGLFMRMKEDDWDDVLRVNLKGTFNCIQAVVRPMMKQSYGTIINISSVVGIMGNAGQANYAASKAGLIGLTKSIAKELSSRNITVNAIAPGYILTDMTDEISDEAKENFLQNIPLGRPGTTDDVSAAALFLASEGARYITGQTLNVNGGLLMN